MGWNADQHSDISAISSKLELYLIRISVFLQGERATLENGFSIAFTHFLFFFFAVFTARVARLVGG